MSPLRRIPTNPPATAPTMMMNPGAAPNPPPCCPSDMKLDGDEPELHQGGATIATTTPDDNADDDVVRFVHLTFCVRAEGAISSPCVDRHARGRWARRFRRSSRPNWRPAARSGERRRAGGRPRRGQDDVRPRRWSVRWAAATSGEPHLRFSAHLCGPPPIEHLDLYRIERARRSDRARAGRGLDGGAIMLVGMARALPHFFRPAHCGCEIEGAGNGPRSLADRASPDGVSSWPSTAPSARFRPRWSHGDGSLAPVVPSGPTADRRARRRPRPRRRRPGAERR